MSRGCQEHRSPHNPTEKERQNYVGKSTLSLKTHGQTSRPGAWLPDSNKVQLILREPPHIHREYRPVDECIPILFRVWHPPWQLLLNSRSWFFPKFCSLTFPA